MDYNMMLQMILTSLLPVIWTSMGPLVTTAVTAWVNSVVGKYVPRPVQVVLSGVVGAILAGLTGPAAGVDPNLAASIGLAGGLSSQTYLSLHPRTLLASAPEKVPGT